MMTAMARLPCKQTSPSQQPRYSSGAQAPPPSAQAQIQSPNSYVQSRGYWEMQQPVQAHPAPPYVRNHHRHHAEHVGKRKSAVELLQESKAFYVKSETVLDRKQELKNSGHLQVSQITAPGAPPRLLRKCGTPVNSQNNCNQQQQSREQQQMQNQSPCCWATCHDTDRQGDIILSPQRTLPPALPPKSPRLVPVPQRRSGSISGTSYHINNGACDPRSSSEQLQIKLRRLLNTDSKENVFFPEMPTPPPAEYATPSSPLTNGTSIQTQQNREDKFRYSPGGSLSPGFRDDERTWAASRCDEVRFKFGRSNSHSHGGRAGRSGSGGRSSGGSHGVGGGSASSETIAATGVVCHKSLPDLHTSTRRRASLSPRASTKSSSRKQLQQTNQIQPGCPDCETGSDYSDRSFNRDSVCYRRSSKKRSSSRHIRRSMGSGGGDASSVLSSGGRTQKSSGSSKLSHGATARDSGGSSGHCTHRSEPPPRIQDCWSHVRRDSGASTQHSTERDRSRKSSSYNNSTPPPAIVRHYSPDTDSSNSQTDYSPTCNSRFSDGWKEGRGRPILRSKSDISDRYWRHDSSGVGNRSQKAPARPPRSMTQLESFFDRLGLDPDNYQHITEPSSKTSSPVFFDSVSSVDSALGLYSSWAANSPSQQQWQNNNCSNTAMANNIDDCVVGAGQRSNDQPSIVERNARIIKWLCQCRKVQFGYS